MCIVCLRKILLQPQTKNGAVMSLKNILSALQTDSYMMDLAKKAFIKKMGHVINFEKLEKFIKEQLAVGTDLATIKAKLRSLHVPEAAIQNIDIIFADLLNAKTSKQDKPLDPGTKLDELKATGVYTGGNTSSKPKPPTVESLQEIITNLMTSNSELKRDNNELKDINQQLVDNQQMLVQYTQKDINDLNKLLKLPVCSLVDNIDNLIASKKLQVEAYLSKSL